MIQDQNRFCFKTKFDVTILLGKKAKNVSELLEHMGTVPASSIYYHTHRFLQQHHYLSPEPPNDFAYWVSNVLSEDALGERLSSIDIIRFSRIEDLRNTIIDIVKTYLNSTSRRVDVPEGEEFYFMASKIFVIPTQYVAHSLVEFKKSLRQISIHSLYYHIFDAHLRLGQGKNDFTIFFEQLGKTELSKEIARLDPYTQTLEGLKQKILLLVEKHDRH